MINKEPQMKNDKILHNISKPQPANWPDEQLNFILKKRECFQIHQDTILLS